VEDYTCSRVTVLSASSSLQCSRSRVALLEKIDSAPLYRQGIVISNVDHAHNVLPLFVNLQLNSKIHQENMADLIIPPYALYCQSMLPHLIVSVAVQCLPQSRAASVTHRPAIL